MALWGRVPSAVSHQPPVLASPKCALHSLAEELCSEQHLTKIAAGGNTDLQGCTHSLAPLACSTPLQRELVCVAARSGALRLHRHVLLGCRAPHNRHHTTMWLHLLTGTPHLVPGRDSLQQTPDDTQVNCNLLTWQIPMPVGRPSHEDLDVIQSQFATTMLECLPGGEPKPFSQLFPNASPEAADLMSKLLHFNPNKRISAAEALKHPYVAQFHNEADEPSAPGIITIPIDDNHKVSCPDMCGAVTGTLTEPAQAGH